MSLPANSAIVPDFSQPGPKKHGLELEMFGFDARTLAPLGHPDARVTPQQLMERVHSQVAGSHLKVDAATGVIVGLELGCGNFSLEPGGQLEYASCPQEDLAGLQSDLAQGLAMLEEAAAGEVVFLDHGTNPLADASLGLYVPKLRYQILDRYFASQPGGRGVHMMRYSATAQPNIDIPGSGDDWLDAVRLTFALTPFARHLFANSRYFHNRLCNPGMECPGSERQRIWAAIDSSRTGIPEGVPEADDLIAAYLEWARQAFVFVVDSLPLEEQPLYGELTFATWERDGYRGTRPGPEQWAGHLGTLFPDLRLRRFLEIRMVDAQPFAQALAPSAFWAALQRPQARERLWRVVQEAADEVGLRSRLDVLKLRPELCVFRHPDRHRRLLEAAAYGADELTAASLKRFEHWLNERCGLDYPRLGVDFVRAQASSRPSQQVLLTESSGGARNA